MAAVLVAVMLTYFLAAWAKIRFGGWDWPTGSTLTRAVLRRGTPLSDWTLEVPWLLPAAQWADADPGARRAADARSCAATAPGSGWRSFLIGFHLMIFAGVTIIFLPHCIAILSILPWERLTARFARRRLRAWRPARRPPRRGRSPPPPRARPASEGGRAAQVADPGPERGQGDRLDLPGGALRPPPVALARGLQPRPVVGDPGQDARRCRCRCRGSSNLTQPSTFRR